MKNLLKITFICLLFVFSIKINTLTVFAGNDGKPKDDPYTDSGYEKSYDVEYYDCNVPYTLSYEEVGGVATGGYPTSGPGYIATPMSNPDEKVGTKFIWENDHNSGILSGTILGSSNIGKYKGFSKIEDDPDTHMCVVTDKNGAKYYVAAFSDAWVFKYNDKDANAFTDNGFGLHGSPILVDVYLSDSNVVHFIMGDGIGKDHTNREEIQSVGQDGVHFTTSKLNYEQYRYMFHCNGGQLTELWGDEANCQIEFAKKYNIGNNDGQCAISVIRMYNATLDDPPKRLNGNDVSSLAADHGAASGDNSNSFIGESALVGMPDSSVLGNDREDVQLANRDDLSIEESNNLVSIKDNLDIKNSTTALDLARKISVFIGLLLMVYAILLILAITIDMINMWVDVSITRILTFGLIRVQTSPDEPITPKGYISPRKLRIVAIVIFLIGGVIISGGMFRVTSKLMWWITKKFV